MGREQTRYDEDRVVRMRAITLTSTMSAVGYWLDFSHGSYRPLFVCAGTAYLIALGIIHLMAPHLERTDL
jgi:hypothetical protein